MDDFANEKLKQLTHFLARCGRISFVLASVIHRVNSYFFFTAQQFFSQNR